MKSIKKKIPYKRIALILTLCILVVWTILGTGASLAWFTDTSSTIKNNFHFGELDLVVSHRLPNGDWEEIDGQTKIFSEDDLYEPGHVQVVYMKVKNKGTVPFKFDTAVIVNDCNEATNVFGQPFFLQDYLKFGITTNNTEADMDNSVPDRETAVIIADEPLYNYYEEGSFELQPEGEKYIALIVRMPEEVDNVANYRGDEIPTVELGVTFRAEQLTA